MAWVNASAAERVCEWGVVDQWPKDRNPIFFTVIPTQVEASIFPSLPYVALGSESGGEVSTSSTTGMGLPHRPAEHYRGDVEKAIADLEGWRGSGFRTVVIYPGHGPATTIARELRSNPFLNGTARVLGA